MSVALVNNSRALLIGGSGGGGGQTFIASVSGLTGYSWYNQSTSTIVVSGGTATMVVPGASLNHRLYVKNYLTPPFTYTVSFVAAVQGGTEAGSGTTANGMTLYDSASGKIVNFFVGTNGMLFVTKYSNFATFSAHYTMDSPFRRFMPPAPLIWLRFEDDGTNRTYKTSLEGDTWYTLLTTTSSDYLTPDKIGLVTTSANSLSVATIYYSIDEA